MKALYRQLSKFFEIESFESKELIYKGEELKLLLKEYTKE